MVSLGCGREDLKLHGLFTRWALNKVKRVFCYKTIVLNTFAALIVIYVLIYSIKFNQYYSRVTS
ncbi:hypothetical protein F5K02_02710 [Bacillus amyloliquefaciens]|nr:hypothetical protein F5K02_02710 [Bacillus amyloliquefaciens]